MNALRSVTSVDNCWFESLFLLHFLIAEEASGPVQQLHGSWLIILYSAIEFSFCYVSGWISLVCCEH